MWTVLTSRIFSQFNSRQIYGTVVIALVSSNLTLVIITRFHDKITINSFTEEKEGMLKFPVFH